MKRKEGSYSHPVKQRLKELFEEKVDEVHLESLKKEKIRRKKSEECGVGGSPQFLWKEAREA